MGCDRLPIVPVDDVGDFDSPFARLAGSIRRSVANDFLNL